MSTTTKLSWILLFVSLVGAGIALFKGVFIFKASTGLLGIVVCLLLLKAKAPKSIGWIVAAFAFSVVGDYFLTFMKGGNFMFLKGISLYFFAHIAYLAFAWNNGSTNWKITGFLLTIFITYYSILLYPSISEITLKIAVLIYLLVSCLSFGVAIGMKGTSVVRWTFASGIGLILVSDTLISLKDFLGIGGLEFSILLTYYLAHSLVTLTLIIKSYGHEAFSNLPAAEK